MHFFNRYFGNDEGNLEQEQERKEFEKFYEHIFWALGTFIIDDYIPYLSFITTLQGWIPRLKEIRQFSDDIGAKLADLDKHRQRAQDRKIGEDYVPDFVDVLLTAKMEDGKPLPDMNIKMILMVSISYPFSECTIKIMWSVVHQESTRSLILVTKHDHD